MIQSVYGQNCVVSLNNPDKRSDKLLCNRPGMYRSLSGWLVPAASQPPWFQDVSSSPLSVRLLIQLIPSPAGIQMWARTHSDYEATSKTGPAASLVQKREAAAGQKREAKERSSSSSNPFLMLPSAKEVCFILSVSAGLKSYASVNYSEFAKRPA